MRLSGTYLIGDKFALGGKALAKRHRSGLTPLIKDDKSLTSDTSGAFEVSFGVSSDL